MHTEIALFYFVLVTLQTNFTYRLNENVADAKEIMQLSQFQQGKHKLCG